MRRILLFLIIGSFYACDEKSNSSQSTYFAGEIVNPTSNYVVLYKNDIVLDSAKLDESNRFSFTIENIDEGLHHFDHSPELQYIFLEKGDSILVRLNTVAFDESLVFSGSNEDVNNFMIEMFLNYEDEEHLIYSYYKLAPEDFSNKIDSLRSQKINELNSLSDGEELSDNAFAMAKASIDYNSYLYKEKYPFYHKKKTGEDTFHDLDSKFYAYRDNLNVNNADLVYFRPYYDFMINHFGNLSYMACMKQCGMDAHLANKNHLHLNRHKMVLIDSIVLEQDLRDNLFRNVTMDYLLKVHESSKDCDSFIADFEKLSKNQHHKDEITNLYFGIKNLQAKKEIPDLLVENSVGEETSLKEIAKDKNTVFYFWTATQKRHFRNVSKHIKKLRKSHPEYTYVGINLKTSKPQWLAMVHEHQLDTLNQYWGNDFEHIQQSLIVDGLNKCVITEDTLIVDAFANLYYSFSPNKTKKALVVK
ncbi:transaldolase [Croceitalea rosinachiae]|uniref:Transaldolase n=1 Tax=Croceitalea rosinachiae TaxID=3075596 RepID=A0ABU3AAU8_9FLAO|nr:transaldolase [Croceitalea sp. F388]MDT0607311.1 transaldolase [Croceitalea sp. F388]